MGTDDRNGHETHRSAMDINIPAASANSDLRSLQECLRNTNNQKLVRECDCGENSDAVEAEDEGRIIICRQKGCETLWVSVFGVISFHLLTTY
jgi:frataxin-like iron-binding protein CyaY